MTSLFCVLIAILEFLYNLGDNEYKFDKIKYFLL